MKECITLQIDKVIHTSLNFLYLMLKTIRAGSIISNFSGVFPGGSWLSAYEMIAP